MVEIMLTSYILIGMIMAIARRLEAGKQWFILSYVLNILLWPLIIILRVLFTEI